MIDLTQKLLATRKLKKGKVGRYNVSDLYSILNGYISPEEFLSGEKEPFIDDLTDTYTMWNGVWKHKMIQELLPEYEQEVRKEYKVDDEITLIGKVDWIGEEVGELKTSASIMGEAKKSAIHQVKIYLTMFEREIGRIFQPVVKKKEVYKFGKREKITAFNLKELSVVKRDDSWFNKEMSKLKDFHKKVKKVARLSLEECVKGCENFDEFCEKCNGLLSKSDRIAKEVWDEYAASTK